MPPIYYINWRTLIENFALESVRKPTNLKLIMSLIQPVVLLYVDFLNFMDSAVYKVSHNSQVVYLQKMLNDKFDPSLRRIRIANAEILEPVWLYEPEDNKPVWLYEPEDNLPVYLREESELIGDGVDFTVLVPASLRPSTQIAEQAYTIKMSGQINYYKLYSKNFKIVWIT